MKFLLQLANSGNMPPALLNKPDVSQFEQPFYDAFNTLSGSRHWTMAGPAPIPLSEILAYLKIQNIDDIEERDEYVSLVRALDAEYLDIIQKRTTK